MQNAKYRGEKRQIYIHTQSVMIHVVLIFAFLTFLKIHVWSIFFLFLNAEKTL